MIRAKYVIHEHGERFLAIYDAGVKPRELNDVVERLCALPGVRARATRVALDRPDAPPTTVIWMGVVHQSSPHRAMQLFRELTDPEQSVAIARIDVYFWWCECGRILHEGKMSFLPNFEPEDEEAFKLRFLAAMKRLDLQALWDAEPRVPYAPLMDAITEELAKLGAHATDFYLEPDPKLQPCKHNG